MQKTCLDVRMSKVKHNHLHFDEPRSYSEADFDGYQAAPLLLVGTNAQESLIEAQDRMARKFGEVAHGELAEHVTPRIIDYVARSIEIRMQQREGQNATAYMRRLYHEQPAYHLVDGASREEVEIACNRALYGGATVAQNDMARRAFGMVSGEYANLTIISDFRKDLEAPMWAEVGELVHSQATPHYEQMSNFKVFGFDCDITKAPYIGAVRIGMKRDIGRSADGALVKGRTTAIISPQHYSEFKQSDAQAIRKAVLERVEMAEVPEFRKIVRWLIEEHPPAGVVLARNETVYGFSEDTLSKATQRNGYHFNG